LNTSVPTRLAGGKNTTAEKLLLAASELMIERASIEVSLSDIAQKSGVNAALVKYHFGNRTGCCWRCWRATPRPRCRSSNT
jgi:AcrR family transcriptional regulator